MINLFNPKIFFFSKNTSNFNGTISFGVSNPKYKSSKTAKIIVITTPKSAIFDLINVGKKGLVLNDLSPMARIKVKR